jgi:hypothetical protein
MSGKKRASMASVESIVDYWSAKFGMALPSDRCWICLQEFESLHRAHLIAHSVGGFGDVANLVIACKLCNSLVDGAVSSGGIDSAVEWIRQCAQGRWTVPPLGNGSLLSQLWRQVPAGVDMLQAMELMEHAFKTYANFRHIAWIEGNDEARKRKAKGLKAGKTGGSMPIGKGVDAAGRLVEGSPAEVEALQLIRDLRAGGLSLRGITEELNARGVPCRGERWHLKTVHRLVNRDKGTP